MELEFVLETGAKKTELAFCHIAQKVLPLEKFYSSKGQNDLFQGLKWGIVRICRSTGSWGMVKNIW